MTADPATLAWYEANAARHTTRFGKTPSRHLDRFVDRLAPRARVLELGCGGGRDSARMIERGFDIDATDGSVAMAVKARENFGIAARVMRFEELAASEAYDAAWANACLLHVARADLAGVLGAIHRALRPGGWHYATYKLGEREGRDPFGRLHNFPQQKWLEEHYRGIGFEIVETGRYRGAGADGVQRDWLALTVRRPADSDASPAFDRR